MGCFNQKKQKGFTLIELMITILVIAVGLLGVVALIQNTMSSASSVRLNLVAAYLAQEGIELTRNIRDTNWIENIDWKEGLTGCSEGSSEGCQIDYSSNALSIYNDVFLNVDGNRFYNYDSGSESKFKRKIIVNEITENGDEYLEVKSEVFWDYREEEFSIEVIDHLYDWR